MSHRRLVDTKLAERVQHEPRAFGQREIGLPGEESIANRHGSEIGVNRFSMTVPVTIKHEEDGGLVVCLPISPVPHKRRNGKTPSSKQNVEAT